MPDDSLSEELSEEEFKSKHFLHRLVPSCTDDVRRNVLSPYVQPHVVRQDDGMLWSSTVEALCTIRLRLLLWAWLPSSLGLRRLLARVVKPMPP